MNQTLKRISIIGAIILAEMIALPFVSQAVIALPLNQGGTGWGSSTPCEILVGTTSISKYTRLPCGANGTLLQSNGSNLSYVSTSSLGIVGSSGNAAWTIGNGLIYNATSTDKVGVGTSTPISTLYVSGKGNVKPFIVSSSTGADIFTILQNGNVGINTSNPATTLNVSAIGNDQTIISATGYGAELGNTTDFLVRCARGTPSAPSAIKAGDNCFNFGSRPYSTSGFLTNSTAAIRTIATEDVTDTSAGTALAFFTTPNSSVSKLERFRVDPSGSVLIGTSTLRGNAQLQVQGSITDYNDILAVSQTGGYTNLTCGTIQDGDCGVYDDGDQVVAIHSNNDGFYYFGNKQMYLTEDTIGLFDSANDNYITITSCDTDFCFGNSGIFAAGSGGSNFRSGQDSGPALTVSGGATTQTGNIQLWKDYYQKTQNVAVMSVRGFLGLGTSTPNASLNIYGTTTSPILVSSSTGAKMFELKQSAAVAFNNQTGTSGQILQSNGATAAPTWTNTLNSATTLPNLCGGALTSQTATSSPCSFTSPSSATSSLRVGGSITVNSVSIDVITCQLTYTNQRNNSITTTFFPSGLTSGAISTTGTYSFSAMDVRVNPNTTVTGACNVTTNIGSINYDADISAQQVK